jgi:hypothetical protein
MDEELRMLHEAMVVKDRLRVLAQLQSAYWDELLARGFDQSIAEQLMLDWSRHAYGMTFRALPDVGGHVALDDLLGVPSDGAQPAPPTGSDPSRVPPGEPWLQLVQELDVEDGEQPSSDERAA